MALNVNQKAKLAALSRSGDLVARALLEGAFDVKLTAGAEAANVIKVTGQIIDGAGKNVPGVRGVVVESLPVSGAGTMADGGAGTILKGAASTKVWLETDATGKFELDVTNIVAEANLIVATTNDGDVAMLKLAFA